MSGPSAGPGNHSAPGPQTSQYGITLPKRLSKPTHREPAEASRTSSENVKVRIFASAWSSASSVLWSRCTIAISSFGGRATVRVISHRAFRASRRNVAPRPLESHQLHWRVRDSLKTDKRKEGRVAPSYKPHAMGGGVIARTRAASGGRRSRSDGVLMPEWSLLVVLNRQQPEGRQQLVGALQLARALPRRHYLQSARVQSQVITKDAHPAFRLAAASSASSDVMSVRISSSVWLTVSVWSFIARSSLYCRSQPWLRHSVPQNRL